jgi:integrase
MPKLKRFKKAANNTGSIFSEDIERKDGTVYTRWRGDISLGYSGTGKRKRVTVYGASQAEVVEKLEAVKQRAASGLLADTKYTVKSYFEKWLKEKERQVKRRTLVNYRYDIDTHIVPELGNVRLEKVTPLQLQTLLSGVADKSGVDRANKVRTVLYQGFRQAVKWLLLPRNPAEATEPFKHVKQEMKLWTPQEAAKFLDTARIHRQYALFYLAISSGLRVGELLALEWKDLQGEVLHVQRSIGWVEGELVVSTPKTERGKRKVTLDKATLAVLEGHRKQQEAERAKAGEKYHSQDILFANRHGAYTKPRKLSQHWYELQTLSGVPQIRFHDLRHLNVSLRRKLGQDAKLIADQVGHADPAFTMRQYTHLFEDDRSNAAVNLGEWLPKSDKDPN